HGGGAGGDGGGGERGAVGRGAGQGGEQVARLHLAAVGGHAGNVWIRVDLMADERGQSHGLPPAVGAGDGEGHGDRGRALDAEDRGDALDDAAGGRRGGLRGHGEAAGVLGGLRVVEQDEDQVALAVDRPVGREHGREG